MIVSEVDNELELKLERLRKYIKGLGRVAVAFSSGVDSTFLLYVAKEVLFDDAIAITARANLFPENELKEGIEFCNSIHARQIIFDVDALSIPNFANNPTNRCYICKRHIFESIIAIAEQNEIENVLEGSNVDDLGDYRPGLRAIEELKVKSPLREAGLTKMDIRRLSKKFGLPTWEKPSFACLASRFVYGETITEKRLSQVAEAERVLFELGFRQIRVRIHGDLARIEVSFDEFDRIMQADMRSQIHTRLRKIGFSYVAVDLLGYRTGSMNETIKK